jgi:hypothetical protein
LIVRHAIGDGASQAPSIKRQRGLAFTVERQVRVHLHVLLIQAETKARYRAA